MNQPRRPRRAVLLTAALLLAACQDTSTPFQPAGHQPPAAIGLPGLPGLSTSRYIVVFTDAVTDPVGRADNVYDALTLDLVVIGEDCNGHGTHVAGTVGGVTFGVAKGVSLHGVRVLGCAGVGFTSDVIAGVDWVTANHQSPAVANMSLGGGSSAALNTAVTNLSNSGVFLAVAAGNDNADACNSSPAGASDVFTVAASEKTDAKASYSNWGTCVEAYAPGSAITSDWLLGLTMTLSGTSMATPHVTGTAALYKATFGDAPSTAVSNWIIGNATTGVITGNPGSTPNLLLYKADL